MTRVGSGKGVALAAFLALSFAIAALGGAVTAKSVGTWYQTLAKPWFNPPEWVFAPVWTVLYIEIAVAGWLVWLAQGFTGARVAMGVYFTQLGLNFAWSFIFFGSNAIGMALAEIVVLLAVIGVNVVLFWRIDRMAGWLLVPYVVWVGFASVLNFALWRLN